MYDENEGSRYRWFSGFRSSVIFHPKGGFKSWQSVLNVIKVVLNALNARAKAQHLPQ
jgi:hypothetical protein